MDQVALRNADLLILTALTQTPTANPDSMLGEFCMAVGKLLQYHSNCLYQTAQSSFEINLASTLRAGGCCLVPCHPSGLLYDLFECLSVHLDNIGLSQIPLFFFSPVAETSLAYSNIFAEWCVSYWFWFFRWEESFSGASYGFVHILFRLSQGKQSKVYLPEEPFPHAHLVKNGRLKHFPSLHAEGFTNEYRQPCVVFCGHPSLRFGNAVHFLELWGGQPHHSVVFVEPDFPYLEALAPYQPLAMKVVHCPIDTSLSFTQANKLIRDLKPGHLLVPELYLQPPVSAPLRSDLVIQGLETFVIYLNDPMLTGTFSNCRSRSAGAWYETVSSFATTHQAKPGACPPGSGSGFSAWTNPVQSGVIRLHFNSQIGRSW